jgi:hypothetical protein
VTAADVTATRRRWHDAVMIAGSPNTHRPTHPRARRRAGGLGLAAGLLLVSAAACTKTETVSNPPASAPTGSASSTAGTTPGNDTTTTARSATTTGSKSSTASTAGSTGGDFPTDGPCAYLTPEEVTDAVGTAPDSADDVRGGCRWEQGTTPVLDLEIESPSDPTTLFNNEKAIYGGDGPDLAGIGEDAYFDGLDQKVVFLKDGKIYTVWVQADISDSEKETAAVALATKVASQL